MNIIEPVRKSILVNAAPERAFAIFRIGTWWPKQHSILASGSPQKQVVIEAQAGGRWYEIGEDGTQCDWGKVLACEPPRRLLLAWQLNGEFKYDPSAMTEVEVTFTPEGEATRVELEHRGFENYASGQALRDAVAGDEGWMGLLKLLASHVAAKRVPE